MIEGRTPPKRILTVKLADIGDTLTMTPALRALRRSFPAAHIAALVTSSGRCVLARNDLVDDMITFDQHIYDAPAAALRPVSLLRAWRLARELRGNRYDTLLLLHHLTTPWGAAKYAALALGCGASTRVGLAQVYPDGRPRNRRGWFLTRRVPDLGFGARHEVDHWLALAAAIGATVENARMEYPLRPEEVDWAKTLPLTSEKPLVALYPGSGVYSVARRWPWRNYIAVGNALKREFDAQIVVIGGQQENDLARQVAGGIPGALDLAGATALGQLGALLQRADLLVGNDGGPMHLATAVGTRVVAIFGPSNHRAWGPYAPEGRARVVRVDLPCSPCFYVGHLPGNRHGCAKMECLQSVTPEMVLIAARELLADSRME